MEKFAKLFETEAHGQILVKIDAGDEGPEIRFFFRPKGLGVCSVAISGEDSDKGWQMMESAFEKQTEESASKVVAGVKDQYDLVAAE